MQRYKFGHLIAVQGANFPLETRKAGPGSLQNEQPFARGFHFALPAINGFDWIPEQIDAASLRPTARRAIRRASVRLPQVTSTTKGCADFFPGMDSHCSREASLLTAVASYNMPERKMENRGAGVASAVTSLMASPMTSPIKFGTSGWRGLIADDFTFANVRLAVTAIAEHVKTKTKSPTVLVGYDTRFYSEEFSALAAGILQQHGIRVLLGT